MSKKKHRFKLETPETKAKFDAIVAKHGFRRKLRFIVTTFETADGKTVVRLGPEILMVVEGAQGNRSNWFPPVNTVTAQRAFESQESYQEQQEIFSEMNRQRATAGKKGE